MYGTVDSANNAAEKAKLVLDPLKAKSTAFLSEISVGGNKSIRFLGFAGSGVTLFFTVFQIIGDILNPVYVLLDAFLLGAALLAVFLEVAPYCRGLMLNYELKIEYWAKFLTRSWGKAVLYCFIGAIGLARFTIIWILVAVYMLFVAVMHYQLSRRAASKLNELRNKAKNQLEGEWDEVFARFDTDSDGRLSMEELKAFAQALSMDISMSEEQTILNFLDPKKSGSIDMHEFKNWWMTNKISML